MYSFEKALSNILYIYNSNQYKESVTGESMVNCLGLSLLRNNVVNSITDRPDTIIVVNYGLK